MRPRSLNGASASFFFERNKIIGAPSLQQRCPHLNSAKTGPRRKVARCLYPTDRNSLASGSKFSAIWWCRCI